VRNEERRKKREGRDGERKKKIETTSWGL